MSGSVAEQSAVATAAVDATQPPATAQQCEGDEKPRATPPTITCAPAEGENPLPPATKLKLQSYADQEANAWPKHGKHVLAQFSEADNSIVVYQAFNKKIADYAVQNQRFGGPKYSSTRMTWVKTNFLWMMYRSGWGKKDANQERTLAITLRLDFFVDVLLGRSKSSAAKAVAREKELAAQASQAGDPKSAPLCRLQWDPDHFPNGEKHCGRRAVQLGMKNLGEEFNEAIVAIEDISSYVEDCRLLLVEQGVLAEHGVTVGAASDGKKGKGENRCSVADAIGSDADTGVADASADSGDSASGTASKPGGRELVVPQERVLLGPIPEAVRVHIGLEGYAEEEEES